MLADNFSIDNGKKKNLFVDGYTEYIEPSNQKSILDRPRNLYCEPVTNALRSILPP